MCACVVYGNFSGYRREGQGVMFRRESERNSKLGAGVLVGSPRRPLRYSQVSLQCPDEDIAVTFEIVFPGIPESAEKNPHRGK